jgi:hypothetical protein
MGCFNNLVSSKFLSNIAVELELARKSFNMLTDNYFPRELPFIKEQKSELYNNYLYYYGFLEAMREVDMKDQKALFYIEQDDAMLLFSRSRSVLNDAIRYYYSVTGTIPSCKTKHVINGFTVYTSLTDKRFEFIPVSPN